MIGFPLGLLYSNAGEWFLHKYVLHGLGKRRQSMWSFHWHEHHRNSRRHGFRDPDYERMRHGWNARGKETLGVATMAMMHLPLLPVAPFFTAAICYSAVNYYRVHKRSHRDPEWAREHVPWHYDHHMGPNQDANWCVTRPWFDILMGTREVYIGTERFSRDERKRAMRLQHA